LDQAVALAAREPSIPADQLPPAWTHQAEIFLEEGHFDQADGLFHRAIAADTYTSDAWIGLARVSFLKGDFGAAAESARRNRDVMLDYNRDHLADAAEAEMEWARYQAETGQAVAAVAQVRAALPALRREYSGGYLLARHLQTAARVFNKAGRALEAEQFARESLARCGQSQLPEIHPLIAAATEDLGSALASLKRYREADAALEKAQEMYRRLGPAYALTADRVQAALPQLRAGTRSAAGKMDVRH